MRDKILETLCAHDQDKYGVDMSGKRKINIERAADELTALMCYREVRAFCKGRSQCLNVPNFLVEIFKDSYSKEDILKAIEQVKNEMS